MLLERDWLCGEAKVKMGAKKQEKRWIFCPDSDTMDIRKSGYGRRKKMRARRRRRIFSVAGVLTAAGGWFLLTGLWGMEAPVETPNFVSQAAEELHQPPQSVESCPVVRQTPSSEATSGETSVNTKLVDDDAQKVQDTDSALPAAASGPVLQAAPEGYFSDALFIGDSRTQGLELYGGIDEATYYTSTGLMVNTALVKTVVTLDGEQLSIPDALDRQTFGKIYIMLGVNELGWKSQDRFIEYYGQLIDTVREKQPDAVIYIQTIIPVTRQKSESDETYNNTRIALFNSCIDKVVEDRDVVLLDVGAALRDADGFLPEGSTFDGVHLNQEYCRKWADFLRANTAAE